MTLGEKLRQARLEAGLSQKAVCGDTITRNMLSQIENGAASPSVATLQHLARQLGKPVGYFLGEEASVSPQAPLLGAVQSLERARHLLQAGKIREAREVLHSLGSQVWELPDWIRRQYVLLGARLGQGDVTLLPSLDAELLLRAQSALEAGRDASHFLLCCRERPPQWQLLMGQILMRQQDYAGAAACLHEAEEQYPHQTAPLLEICYRELADFEKAYFYACKGRNLTGK